MSHSSKSYEHFIPAAKENPEWEKPFTHHLVKSIDELRQVLHHNKLIAWDTETSSLNPEEGFIVGFSFTQDGVNGYYVPVNHCDIALGKEALDYFHEVLKTAPNQLLFNCRFDMRFMEFSGYSLEGLQYYDVQNAIWLADTNVVYPSLKWAESHFLGWQAPHFEDVLENATTFQYVPAEAAYRYASIDALGTWHLARVSKKFFDESRMAAIMDNKALYPFMRLENEPLRLDAKYLHDLKEEVKLQVDELEAKLYVLAGEPFKILSPRDLARVFLSMGINTGKTTAKGAMAMDIKTLNALMETSSQLSEDQRVFMKTLITYKQLYKFHSAYLKRLCECADDADNHPVRFSYKLQSVPTGRAACGADSKNTFFAKLNFQSLPKPHSHMIAGRKATPQEIADKKDLLGYVFGDDIDNPEGMVEGQDPHLNVRRAFLPQDDSIFVSIDMCAEELRVVANVFQEETWINAFNSGKDLHRATAELIFGADNYCKEYRKMAKCLAGSTVLATNHGFMSLQQIHDMALSDLDKVRNGDEKSFSHEYLDKVKIFQQNYETFLNHDLCGQSIPLHNFKVASPYGFIPMTDIVWNGSKATIELLFGSELLILTPEHLVKSNGVWKRADSLHVNDVVDYVPKLHSDCIDHKAITGIRVSEAKKDVFDVTVAHKDHSFLANGFIVHNCASFGILYGSTAKGFHERFQNMTLEECEEFIAKFKNALPAIIGGQESAVRNGRKRGSVYTAFGRPRRVKWYCDHQESKWRAFGDRTIKNCYSPDTEFLTADGWKLAQDINPMTELGYFDPLSDTVKFTPAGYRYTQTCDESIKVLNDFEGFHVTKNHRMWVRSFASRWHFIEAEKLLKYDDLYMRHAASNVESPVLLDNPMTKLSPELEPKKSEVLKWLMLYILCNGYVTVGKDACHFILGKPSMFGMAKELTMSLGGHAHLLGKEYYQRTYKLQCTLYNKEIAEICGSLEKTIDEKEIHIPRWLIFADAEVRNGFISLVKKLKLFRKHLDGKETRYLRFISNEVSSEVQQLMSLSGYSVVMHYQTHKGKAFVALRSRKFVERLHSYGYKGVVELVKHEPMEFSCFNVPTHLLVTRYHGHVLICGNTLVQGVAADVLKIIIVRLWERLFSKYPDDIKWVGTIHDEVNVSIKRDRAYELIPIMIQCMTVQLKEWKVPLACSLSVGTTFGGLVEYKYEKDETTGEWTFTPAFEMNESVAHRETKKVDSAQAIVNAMNADDGIHTYDDDDDLDGDDQIYPVNSGKPKVKSEDKNDPAFDF